MKMEPLSKIVGTALDEITNGQFSSLPKLGMTGLLNDFQYAWLKKLKIPYKYEMLDFARTLCNGENKKVFKMTNSKTVEDVRNKFSMYIVKWHKNDDRVILSLSSDGKQIDAKWMELEKYLALNKKDVAR
jgi:hypothetical protein